MGFCGCFYEFRCIAEELLEGGWRRPRLSHQRETREPQTISGSWIMDKILGLASSASYSYLSDENPLMWCLELICPPGIRKPKNDFNGSRFQQPRRWRGYGGNSAVDDLKIFERIPGPTAPLPLHKVTHWHSVAPRLGMLDLPSRHRQPVS